MNPLAIIAKYHNVSAEQARVLVVHSILVTRKALEIGKKVAAKQKCNLNFIYEAAMLHDIGFGFPGEAETRADLEKNFPGITSAYIAHGFYGAEILRREGLAEHARVAESHIGVGLSKSEIVQNGWPMPARDYLPATIEEEIISYADLFYSKKPAGLFEEEPRDAVLAELKSYGESKVETFLAWEKRFS